MRILLLNPPSPAGTQYVRVERCMQKKSAWAGSLWQPMPLLYVQSYLKSKGYSQTKLVDAVAEEMDTHKTIDLIKSFDPDVLVLNTAVPTVKNDLQFAEFAKTYGIKVIAIGVPVTTIPEAFNKKIDFGIRNDPEYATYDIVRNIETKKPIPKKFISATKPFTMIYHPVENLNDLPIPDVSDLKLDAYTLPFTRKRLMLVEPGRGCPYGCIYCLVPHLSGRKLRLRDPVKFVDEIERDYNEYGIRNFLFWVESATFDQKNMIAICDEIIKRNLRINWMTPTRVDIVNPELLKKMHQAGCWMLSYGIESIEPEVLKIIQKGINVEQMENAIKWTRDVEIKVMAHIIFGLPGQTKETLNKTLDWLFKNKVDYAQFYCSVPYWGTQLRVIAEKKGWVESNDYSLYEIDKSVMHTDTLTSKEIEYMREIAFKKFYLRPSKIMSEIWENKTNPKYILNLAKDGMNFLFDWVR